MSIDVFVMKHDPTTRLAGVLEYDGEVAYFYLLDESKPEGSKIERSIRLFSGSVAMVEMDVEILWKEDGSSVEVFLRGALLVHVDVAS